MPRQFQLNISLETVFEHDIETDSYIIWYKDFPEAFAQGRTVDEAEINLIPLVELMWKEHPEDLKKVLLEKYINENHLNPPKVIFPSND